MWHIDRLAFDYRDFTFDSGGINQGVCVITGLPGTPCSMKD